MVIGIITIKPYKKINNQFIGTQFFALGIPLFPLHSFFIVDNLIENGFEIGLHRKHLLKIYACIFTFIIVILSLIPDAFFWSTSTRVLLILLSVIPTLYLLFKFDKMSMDEAETRMFFGKITSINVLPQYVNNNCAIMLKNKFIIQLQNQLGTKEFWKTIVDQKLYTEKDVPLVYIIAAYEYKVNPTKKNKDFMTELKQQTSLKDNKYA